MNIGLVVMGAQVLLATVAGAAETVPVKITGAWTIQVDEGRVEVAGGRIVRVREAAEVHAQPGVRVVVEDEQAPALPVYNPKAGGWMRGRRLSALITQECSATGKLDPASVRVKSAAGDGGEVYVRGTDFEMDESWATLGRLEGGGIAADQPVWIDYAYSPDRLDTIAVTASGRVRYVVGESGVGELYPPRLRPGETAIANVWIPGGTAGLTDENLYVIEHTLASRVPEGESVAERLLPRTLAKLRNGESVRIVSWGDSVTCGGGVNQEKEKWYQYQFLGRLRERFPQAEIELLTAGWGGASSRQYMDAPAGGQHDFQRDVLDPKPDLITIEFVNDAYLKGDAFVKHYDEIMAHLETTGAEVVLITPHYVRPDWMGVETQKVSDDPRPYVASLRAYARERSIALADASRKWGLLWRQGLPYMTLLANSINHPDARGHALFADALMELFPAE